MLFATDLTNERTLYLITRLTPRAHPPPDPPRIIFASNVSLLLLSIFSFLTLSFFSPSLFSLFLPYFIPRKIINTIIRNWEYFEIVETIVIFLKILVPLIPLSLHSRFRLFEAISLINRQKNRRYSRAKFWQAVETEGWSGLSRCNEGGEEAGKEKGGNKRWKVEVR